ncbi:MAG TPA: hypothetical protein PLF01_03660 [Alphaproteobacteria bacterium]|nr:hypothetical protein [Alphaproteobacteria bacterium]
MIRIIGAQKFLALVLLAALMVLLAVYWVYSLGPDIKVKERQWAMNKAEVARMTEDIDKLIKGIEQFAQQKDEFERIQKFGFFDPQNRPEARERLNSIQKESRVLSAKFTIKSAETEPNEKAKDAGYKILNTDIDFSLEALDDLDIYNFIYLMNYGFPGQISIQDINIARNSEITQPVLRQVGLGEPVPLVVAVVRLNWRTMVPDESLAITIDNEGEQ